MEKELVVVIDFGGQYNQLVARRVRECSVYAEVHPYTMSLDKIREMNPKGIIFTGGPNSVYKEDSPVCSQEIYKLGIPILGICYGDQLLAYMAKGVISDAKSAGARGRSGAGQSGGDAGDGGGFASPGDGEAADRYGADPKE